MFFSKTVHTNGIEPYAPELNIQIGLYNQNIKGDQLINRNPLA